MPKIAGSAELRINGRIRRLFIDGVEFPWYSSGISYERNEDFGDVGYVTVRILVNAYSETVAGAATEPVNRVAGGMLTRADFGGLPGQRQPGEPLADDPDAPPATPWPPAEQGSEGP